MKSLEVGELGYGRYIVYLNGNYFIYVEAEEGKYRLFLEDSLEVKQVLDNIWISCGYLSFLSIFQLFSFLLAVICWYVVGIGVLGLSWLQLVLYTQEVAPQSY